MIVMPAIDAVLIMPGYPRPVKYSGLGFLAAALKSPGFMEQCRPNFTHPLRDRVPAEPFNVSVVDMSIAPKDFSLRDYLGDTSPLLIGITSFTSTYRDSLSIARLAEEVSPSSLRITGGWHASPLSKEVIRQSNFHTVVRNEGEETLVEIATLLRYEGFEGFFPHLAEINGHTYRDGKGKAVEMPTHAPLVDLNDYPFVQTGFDSFLFNGYPEEMLRGRKTAYITGSRGCIYNCIYCANPAVYAKKIRFRSPENVLSEMKALYEEGINNFIFRDEIFTADLNRARALAAGLLEMRRSGMEFEWACETRADRFDEQLLDDMKASGLYRIAEGMESGDPDLARYLKNDPDLDLEACGMNTLAAQANGVSIVQYYLFGTPRQTWQSVLKSWLYAGKYPPTLVESFPLADYPGNRTGGLARGLTEGETRTAARLFKNLFTLAHFPGMRDSAEVFEGPIKAFSNELRFCVMCDLVLRSKPGYSDKDRSRLIDGMNLQVITGSHLLDFAGFVHSTKEFVPEMKTSLDFDMFITGIARGFRAPDFLPDVSTSSRMAAAYFNEFLSCAKLLNGYDILSGLSARELYVFFVLLSSIWEISRQNGLETPDNVQMVSLSGKQAQRIRDILMGFSLSEFGIKINGSGVASLKINSVFSMVYKGLCFKVEASSRTISVSLDDPCTDIVIRIE